MNREQIDKYEAWTARLEQNIEELARQRTVLMRLFYAATVVSLVGFYFGFWVGVGAFFTGLMIVIAGLYMTSTRTREYKRDLRRAPKSFSASGGISLRRRASASTRSDASG